MAEVSDLIDPVSCIMGERGYGPSASAPLPFVPPTLVLSMQPARVLVCSLFLTVFTVISLGFPVRAHAEAPTFELVDSDRVVMLGDGLIEQEQYFGWVEVMLSSSFADQDVTFRNLGWNADTPAGASRLGLSLLQAGREPEGEGRKVLARQLAQTQPTVVIFGYGMASALENPDPSKFISEYESLLDDLQKDAPDARLVFLSPLTPWGLSSDHVDHSGISTEVALRYRDAVESIASKFKGHFVDLSKTGQGESTRKDSIHLNGAGYRDLASQIADSLGLVVSDWETSPQAEPLRQAILQKNRWWFNRSRPSNMAYVFGFRKHEQGQNAVEIPQYDEWIAKEEAVIAKRRGLKDAVVSTAPPQTKSKFAEFTRQPHPEFTVGEGLEVSLWAENPLLNKPVQMNFDPAGRLWVASSEAYPMIEVGQSAPDKIVVLQDTTGDGTADKSTVFAEGLLIPTGVIPGDGGVYVAQSTDLLFLKDTDGDGKADERRRVLSGFGTEDTHHNLHTLAWGYDGHLYMNQSVYTRTFTETPHGVVRLLAGGGFRFSTKSLRLQTFFHGLWNAWGHQWDRYGQSFLTDGAGFDGAGHVVPGTMLPPVPGARHTLGLISPGKYPKLCSAEIILGDSFPEDWQGSLITCDFRANRVTRFTLLDDGSGFVTEQQDDLIRTSESSFRPIDVKQGPDGALYVADWSNPIINHGEVDFRDARRDRWHGRIWRITAKESAPRPIVNLYDASTEALLNHLRSRDRYTTDQSRRVLIERPEETKKHLAAWVARQSTDEARLQGLWLTQAIGAQDTALLDQLLECPDGKIRAAAVRVLADWSDPQLNQQVNPPSNSAPSISANESLQRFADRMADEYPRVRLEAISGLTRLRSTESAELALTAIDHPMDRFLDHAMHRMIESNAEILMARIEQPDWLDQDANRQAQLEFVLTSVRPNQASRFLKRFIAKKGIDRSGTGPWIELIAKAGSKTELALLAHHIESDQLDPPATIRAIDALVQAKKLRGIEPDGLQETASRLRQCLVSDAPHLQLASLRLLGSGKMRSAIEDVFALAKDQSHSPSLRSAAIDALRSMGGPGAVDALKSLAKDSHGLAIRTSAVTALSAMDVNVASEPFFELLSEVETEPEAVNLWRSILAPKNAGAVLAKRLPKDLTEMTARAGVRAAKEGGRNLPSLVAALTPLAGMTTAKAVWSPEMASEIKALVETNGNASRGESIYRNVKLQCVLCHAIGGVGGKVGPDLSSLGASAPVDYLIESMFDPNAKIKENFHSITIMTDDGRMVSGIESGSTEDEVILRDATGKLIRIPETEIEARQNGKSLMPEGLLDEVAQQDQVDLIRFLSELGKPGDFDASRQNVARSLELFAGTHHTEQQGNQDLIAGKEIPGWQPLHTQVNGQVTKDTLQAMTVQPINVALVHVYLRTKMKATREVKAHFRVDGDKPCKMWIDGQAVESSEASSFTATLAAGNHTVLVCLDSRDLPDSVAIRSDDVTFVSE